MSEDARIDEQGRPVPPEEGSELEMLGAFLDFHRATLLWKVEGVGDAELRQEMTPSGLSLLGLVKHLTAVEQGWFVEGFANLEAPFPIWIEGDERATWRIEPDETTEEVVERYRVACDASRSAIAGASADDHARWPGDEKYTLRFLLLHMIEETARHNGHADILRERIDGATGE